MNKVNKNKKPVKPIFLYWVTTEDSDEDWFIFARNRRSAERFHEEYEGYNSYDAAAEKIMTVTGRIGDGVNDDATVPRHAQMDDLSALGFLCVENNGQRMVMLGARTFVEGALDSIITTRHDDIFEARGEGRPNGTVSADVKAAN